MPWDQGRLERETGLFEQGGAVCRERERKWFFFLAVSGSEKVVGERERESFGEWRDGSIKWV